MIPRMITRAPTVRQSCLNMKTAVPDVVLK